MPVVLHVAPHPDDECLGAPGTLLRLSDRGARVVVVACGLGRPADHARRRRELEAATRVAGHELLVREPPAALASTDDLVTTRELLIPWIVTLIDEYRAEIVVGPHPHDPHPAHQVVAQALGRAIPRALQPPVWWAWAIWADLQRPTLLVPIGPAEIRRVEATLRCYHGELERNNYVEMMKAHGTLGAFRGIERVFGFGSRALPGVDHAELLTELGWVDGTWRLGHRRVDFQPELPVAWAEIADDLGEALRHSDRFG
jgi:LmbE family N-acetylglucosaminyl deacetylase